LTASILANIFAQNKVGSGYDITASIIGAHYFDKTIFDEAIFLKVKLLLEMYIFV